jgi:nitronate monooxygenase
MKRFKEGGVKVIHKTPAVRFARTAESIGVDAVVILGCEGAGHIGMNNIASLVLIPRAVEELKIPVIAAGGICDARSFVAALALGAEGVLMGTRFMATHECPLHPKVKEWLIRTQETDTMLIQQSIRNTARVLKNKPAERTLEMEAEGATLEELIPTISGLKEKELFETGELDAGIFHCGQGVGLIHEITSVKEAIDDIINGARSICQNLAQPGPKRAADPG